MTRKRTQFAVSLVAAALAAGFGLTGCTWSMNYGASRCTPGHSLSYSGYGSASIQQSSFAGPITWRGMQTRQGTAHYDVSAYLNGRQYSRTVTTAPPKGSIPAADVAKNFGKQFKLTGTIRQGSDQVAFTYTCTIR
ncbi:MAG: hypothetical protein LBK95_04065 [Bifidobacteriaceae bacterium]|jgi:hypothetical protein|nr:hypothetical protein [Bifidobacteriaceae bacterium]